MQLLQGNSLDEYLQKKGPPGIPQIVRVARETAAGLAAAHRIGLIHRDIKPANLWLEAPNGRVKVLDFGLARPVDTDVELTGSGVVVGTPAYMSPEQARGLKVDARSDLFSLGSVLYRLCTGRFPFDGPNAMAVLTALAVDDPRPVRELNPAVPNALADLIHQLLAKQPADRPETADEVVRRLRAIAEELAVPTPSVGGSGPIQVTLVPETNPFEDIDQTAAEPTPLPTVRPRPGPNRQWIWVTAAALLVVGGAVGVILATKRGGAGTKNESPDATAGAARDRTGKPTAPETPVSKPPGPIDPERAAATWIASSGGMVQVNGEGREIRAAADLPNDRFTVTFASLWGRPLTETGLANLKGLRAISALNLEGTGTTDAGLSHLKDVTSLGWLVLVNTAVTGEGLAHLKSLTGLYYLDLAGTRVTDAGLAYLKGLSGLTYVNVRKTQVTAEGAAALHAAVPGCKVDWDGGTLGPKK
jgi:eukaryotic-like serine/threonine-protein kinase